MHCSFYHKHYNNFSVASRQEQGCGLDEKGVVVSGEVTQRMTDGGPNCIGRRWSICIQDQILASRTPSKQRPPCLHFSLLLWTSCDHAATSPRRSVTLGLCLWRVHWGMICERTALYPRNKKRHPISVSGTSYKQLSHLQTSILRTRLHSNYISFLENFQWSPSLLGRIPLLHVYPHKGGRSG